jgi:hypothetical protein
MAAATFDLKALAGGQMQNQTCRRFEHYVDVNAATVAAGVGFGAGESGEFYTTPAGCVIETVEAFVLTKADGANTIDIGDEANPDGWLDGGDVYVDAIAHVAKAGNEDYRALAKGGKLYQTATGLRLTSVAAEATLKVRVYITGYMVDL